MIPALLMLWLVGGPIVYNTGVLDRAPAWVFLPTALLLVAPAGLVFITVIGLGLGVERVWYAYKDRA